MIANFAKRVKYLIKSFSDFSHTMIKNLQFLMYGRYFLHIYCHGIKIFSICQNFKFLMMDVECPGVVFEEIPYDGMMT